MACKKNQNDSTKRFGSFRLNGQTLIKPKEFQNVVASGFPGMQRKIPSDFVLFYVWGYYDSLRIYKVNDVDVRIRKNQLSLPASEIQIPNQYKEAKNNYFTLLINNQNYCVGVLSGSGKPAKRDSLPSVLILNKSTNEWHRFSNEYSILRVMNWKDWLYGTIVLENQEQSNNISFFRPNVNRYDTTYGKPVHCEDCYQGILFLYHIPSKKYIEWNTKDSDSEIILIEKGKLYYRVFDEIREVCIDSIKNEIDWSTDKLVIKDKKVIPFVHWMFFSKKAKVNKIRVGKKEVPEKQH